MQCGMRLLALFLGLSLLLCRTAAAETRSLSHPPKHPLPTPSERPLEKGPTYFVDPSKGDDANDGSRAMPFKTINHGVKRLKPGDTLCLRGGTYYEHVAIAVSGELAKPITIRSHPGELAILDGGLREFFKTPEKAWEPCPGGVEGEFQSAKTYADLGGTGRVVWVVGHFGDSMVPMQNYWSMKDLRDGSMAWDIKDKTSDAEGGVYCGPGICLDAKTGRIHARLAHTTIKGLGDDNYRGETDPRKLPLVIAGGKTGPLTIRGARNLRFQDMVVRGARNAAIEITDSANLTFDGLTVYGGYSAFTVKDTHGLRVLNTACRGIAAPWTFRGHLKYRSFESRIFSASGWLPTGADSRDFELAFSEFTDSVDGIFIGTVKGVDFHHNLVDNISDDGIFLTAPTAYDGTTPGGDVRIYQNLLSRCLTTFAFGVGHGRQRAIPGGVQTGSGVHIYRNVFDFRRPVMYHFPPDLSGNEEPPFKGRFASDHGSPAWEPMTIYHNTILADGQAGYAYGALGLGDHMGGGTKRRVFNNIICQVKGLPPLYYPPTDVDFQADGNLFWSADEGVKVAGDFFAKFRQSKEFAASQARYAPGWSAHDRFADPKFAKLSAAWRDAVVLHLKPGSAAIDAGIDLPADWPDPLREIDEGKPDPGALPAGAESVRVGVRGRLSLSGNAGTPMNWAHFTPRGFAAEPARSENRRFSKPAAIVEGYPEFDAPLIDFALRRQGVRVDRQGMKWLDTREYEKYSLVVIAGDLQRAAVKPDRYTADDVANVEKFLNGGGTLWIARRAKRVFDLTPEGKRLLYRLTEFGPPEKTVEMKITEPKHPWVKHLNPGDPHPWLATSLDRDTAPLRPNKGERIVSSRFGTTNLYRLRVGKGQLIYMGWQVHDFLAPARGKGSAVAQEKAFDEQMQVLFNMAAEMYPDTTSAVPVQSRSSKGKSP
jgi:hypothetical protein